MMLCHKGLLNTGNVNFPGARPFKYLRGFHNVVHLFPTRWRSMRSFGATCRRLSLHDVGCCVWFQKKWSRCRIPIRRLCLIPWQFFVDWLLRQRHRSYFHQWVTWPWKVTKVMGQTGENQRINFEILRFATFAPWNLPQSLGRTRLSPFWRAHYGLKMDRN